MCLTLRNLKEPASESVLKLLLSQIFINDMRPRPAFPNEVIFPKDLQRLRLNLLFPTSSVLVTGQLVMPVT